jgi:hypothetical protein
MPAARWTVLAMLALLTLAAIGCRSGTPAGYTAVDPMVRNANDVYPNRD